MAHQCGSLSPLNRPPRPLRTILAGTTLGEGSDRVVRAALALARAAGARLVLVHAVEVDPVGYDLGAGAQRSRELLAVRRNELRLQLQSVGAGEGEVDGKVAAGPAHRVLGAAARQTGTDLIVVGATGSGAFVAELLGSTAERVLRKSVCPVLVVRNELPVPPRRVLAPVDLSTCSGDAFHDGLHLLAQLGGGETMQVEVVHALSFLDAVALRQRPGGTIEDARQEAAAALRRFVLENRPDRPVALTTALLDGEARREIVRELEEHPYDLVLVGSHGRGGLDRLVLGSVAASVARDAPCSVLMVPPEATLAEGDIAEAVDGNLRTPEPEPIAVG